MDEFSSSPTNNEFSSSPPPEFISSPSGHNDNNDNQEAVKEEEEEPTVDEASNNNNTNNDEWVAYSDENGQTYYCNSQTGESSWKIPTTTSDDSEMLTGEVEEEHQEQQHETSTEEVPTAVKQEEDVHSEQIQEEEQPHNEAEENQQEWVAYTDDEGREYYYNGVTGATQWDKPETMETITAQPQSPPLEELQSQQDGLTMEEEEENNQINIKEEVPIEEEEDPIEVLIKKAESFLSTPDAILEPNCIQFVSDLVTNLGPEIGGPKAMQLLTTSFHGYTAICGQLALWLSKLSYSNTIDKASGNSSNKNAAAISFNITDSESKTRKIAEEVVHKMATSKFTKQSGDDILNLSKTEATFLEQMIDIPCWRSLLIDLASKYSDSALLMYCLQSISKKGYHREITKRVKGSTTSDYFVVFNAMLMSELVVLGKMAVGGNVVDKEVLDIGVDLKRSCGSTSYTFIYALELLEELIEKASIKIITEKQPHRSIGLRRAIRKWERFKEDLIDSMLVSKDTGIAPMIKRRKVDITLSVMDFYQHPCSSDEEKKDDSTATDADDDEIEIITTAKNENDAELHSAILCLLKNYAYSKVMDSTTADQLLIPPQQHNNNNNEEEEETPNKLLTRNHYHKIGELLTNNSSAIISLLGNLFKTGTYRLRSHEVRKQCAKLIALSVISSRRQLSSTEGNSKKFKGSIKKEVVEDNKENELKDIVSDKEEEEEINHLCNVLIKGCAITEKLENMVGFTVSDDPTTITSNNNTSHLLLDEKISSGRQLTFLVKHNPILAQGVLIWSIDLSNSRDFVSSAAYPTLAPSILSLIRIMSIYHPFTRHVVLHLTLTFLHHSSNRELSYAKAHAIKQQALRLLLFLSTQGQALIVFCSITDLVSGGSSSDIDSSLLRYFIKGCLDIILPPISLPLSRVMGKLLLTKLCKEALCSSYFEQMPGDEGEECARFPKCRNAKDQLVRLVGFMDKCVKEEKKLDISNTLLVSEDDCSLMSMLVSTYGSK